MPKSATNEWLPLDMAATQYGYSLEGLRRRLRQLRARGHLLDTGRPPKSYSSSRKLARQREVVVVWWVNSRTALIRADAPPTLLNPKRGKRAPGQL